jgi:transposase-like protein
MQKTHYTKQKMLTYYKEWQESGLGKKAYCSQKGLNASTFFYWIRKLALQNQALSAPATSLASAAGFKELILPAPVEIAATSEPLLEIEYPSGARLKLYRQTEASWIKALL